VKGLAILTKERSPALPNLPTALEQGTDVQAYPWTALFLPRRTPDAIVQTLNNAVVQALHTPTVRMRILELGSTVVADERTTPQYLAGFVKSEIEKWAAPIKGAVCRWIDGAFASCAKAACCGSAQLIVQDQGRRPARRVPGSEGNSGG
jgi:tripartite-type tricarboxylate transporter receptor subunit TctC